MTIARLDPAHAEAYRTITLEALALHPDAYTSSADERALRPASWWEARLNPDPDSNEVVLGAFDDDGALVGSAGLSFEAREKGRHKVTLFGMYVTPRCRRSGLGAQLMNAALDYASARPHAKIIQLTVTEANACARSLYQRLGFSTFGVEPYAIALGERYLSKVHMWRALADLD
ncbi:GNAT family N-acetyltransferase [Massilia violaceinigra]|uniref:GNAT family N-acetyltransferase n=1 Tax=Massilia violaceinigra TaxID=2045208 RepID=A0ABY4AA26_9BURK|nr:GNAT family N-acetyltransferase [Massilia violaceinigra]UOD31654.1 GNAT family N-acetyltransferase [Massilia violaceinigra]